jgi:hypothetical protein
LFLSIACCSAATGVLLRQLRQFVSVVRQCDLERDLDAFIGLKKVFDSPAPASVIEDFRRTNSILTGEYVSHD